MSKSKSHPEDDKKKKKDTDSKNKKRDLEQSNRGDNRSLSFGSALDKMTRKKG